MKELQLDLTDERVAEQSRNLTAMVGVGIMNAVLTIAYLFEVIKGVRSGGSYALVAAGCIIPTVLSILAYLQKKDTMIVRYISCIGFSLLYAYIMFTSSTNVVFCYVIVIFVVVSVYVDRKLSIVLGIFALAVNISAIARKGVLGILTEKEITEAEIMLACLLLTGVFTLMANDKIQKINQANINRAGKEKEQSENLLRTILKVADAMAGGVSKATEETEQLKKSIEVTKSAMEELTGGTNDAVTAVLLQQKNTEEINMRIEEVGEVTDSIMTDVGCTEDNLQKGQEVMNQLIRQVEVSEEASRLVAKEMNELQEYADEMQGIMALISNVASQTGLLALNASIEAARAGEAGRGFAVVASEISNLAGQTSTATGDINELIENITKSLKEVTDSVGGLLDSNRMQNEYVSGTAENFEKIHSSTQSIFDKMDRLKGMVDSVEDSNKVIIESIESVSAVTEEVTAGANETFEGSLHNLESVATLADIMENLSKTADELRETK